MRLHDYCEGRAEDDLCASDIVCEVFEIEAVESVSYEAVSCFDES